MAEALYTPDSKDDQDRKDSPAAQTPEQLCSFWLGQIQQAEKKLKAYRTRGRQIIKRYKNKRLITQTGVPIQNRRMNVLWSNVQTLKPVLYSTSPKANVSRRNKTKDPVGRTASIVLQNVLQNSIGMEDFDYTMEQVIDDRLLPGAGVAIVEYRPEVEGDQVGWQAAETRYLHWEDWITNEARTWDEVWFFGYPAYLTRAECYQVALDGSGDDEAFAADVRSRIVMDHKDEESKSDGKTEQPTAKAVVWCIWDKTTKKVLHVAPSYPSSPLAVMDPPVSFDGFFANPRPLQATTTNDSTQPVPDFDQYVDQADEIDLLTQRIGGLTKSLRLRGIYAGDMESIKQMMEAGDNELIPVENFLMLMERGGLGKSIEWYPVREVAETLFKCIEARNVAIEIMYQVTGISDIMRGSTEASETASAQQLKAQFGSVRVRKSQRDTQRFIRDILRKKAEVISEHFTLEVIQAMSGVKLLTGVQKQTIMRVQELGQQFQQAQQQAAQMAQQQGMPPPQIQPPAVLAQGQQALETLKKEIPDLDDAMREPSWEEVMGLLRNEKLRGFVVDVETDSTIEPDQKAQQQAAAEFATAVATFMTAAFPIMQAAPDSADFLGELMAWVTRQWKGADTIESALDEFVEKMKKKASEPPPPNPMAEAENKKAEAEVMKAQSGVEVAKIGVEKAKIEMQGAALDHQHKQAEHAMDMQAMQQEGVAQQQSAELGERQHQQAMEQAAMKPKEAA